MSLVIEKRYTSPTKLDEAAQGSRWHASLSDGERCFIQTAPINEPVRWQDFGAFMVDAYFAGLVPDEVIEKCLEMYKIKE